MTSMRVDVHVRGVHAMSTCMRVDVHVRGSGAHWAVRVDVQVDCANMHGFT